MKCRWATLHWIRFVAIETAESFDLSSCPVGAASWKIGPDGPAGPEGTRLPSDIWCAVGLYRQRTDAAMIAAAYRPGAHRDRIDRHRNEEMADRISFTRLRAIRAVGTWHGLNPVAH